MLHGRVAFDFSDLDAMNTSGPENVPDLLPQITIVALAPLGLSKALLDVSNGVTKTQDKGLAVTSQVNRNAGTQGNDSGDSFSAGGGTGRRVHAAMQFGAAVSEIALGIGGFELVEGLG